MEIMICKKGYKKFLECHYNGYYCGTRKKNVPLFNCIKAYEGIILENEYNSQQRIFLVHGHQGDSLMIDYGK